MPCPLCGGLLHPVAGRCKHCKADLTTYRGGRPQAARALPALLGGTAAPKATATPIPAPLAIAKQSDDEPILPPRESARMPALREPSAFARRWPLVVMVIAGLAIVGAVVVMFALPPEKKDQSSLPPPPAPEKMQLNPLPEPSHGPTAPTPPTGPNDDPWGPSPGTGGHTQITPPSRNNAPDPLPPLPPAAPNAPDPFGGINGALAGNDPLGGLGGNDMMAFSASVLRHACDRLSKCGISDSMTQTTCNAMSAFPQPAAVPTCATAKRCLAQIDNLDCATTVNDVGGVAALMTQVPDCLEAMTSC